MVGFFKKCGGMFWEICWILLGIMVCCVRQNIELHQEIWWVVLGSFCDVLGSTGIALGRIVGRFRKYGCCVRKLGL